MALFKCKVIDDSGKKQVVYVDAFSTEESVDYLKKNNYIIIDVKKAKKILDFNSFFGGFKKIKSRDLSIFCKQLHSMLKAGITIINCIEILSIQTENMRLRNITGEMYKELQTGNTFSESLSNHRGSFPDIFISMIESGEISGNIDAVVDRLSCHFEKEYKIENKVKSAMTYPIILAIVSTTVVIFLLINVMPTFADLYSSSGIPLPLMTVFLLNISNVIKRAWYLMLIIIAIIVFGIPKMICNEKIRYKLDRFKMRVPLYKNMVVKLAMSRFTRTLSTLMGSGVLLLQALETVSKVTGNSYIGKIILEVKEDVRRGLSLSQSLRNQNVFPPMVYYMIKIGENSGSIEELLDKTANLYDEEVENAVQKLITMVEPLMIVLMAAVIGFIVLAMITPMFDLVKTVQ